MRAEKQAADMVVECCEEPGEWNLQDVEEFRSSRSSKNTHILPKETYNGSCGTITQGYFLNVIGGFDFYEVFFRYETCCLARLREALEVSQHFVEFTSRVDPP